MMDQKKEKETQGVEFRIKFSVPFAFWESKGDIEHTMRYIWKRIADDYKIGTKDLTIQSSKHGIWPVYPENNNLGCNCDLCNPRKKKGVD